MAEPSFAMKRLATALATLPSPADFLRAERRTPPRLLPLWAMALIALAGHTPGSTAWTLTAILALLLGVALAPVVGSIRPTVVAYVWLLVLIAAMTLVTRWFQLGVAYDDAWLDQGHTGMLAMILIGAVAVGGFTSLLWGLLVAAEALRRLLRRGRLVPSPLQEPPVPVSVEPAASHRARRFAALWRRAFIGLVCVGAALPLPSFFQLAGIHSARLRAPHEGVGDAFAGAVHASAWPALTLLWLALAAGIGWLVWLRTLHAWRIVGIALGVVVVLIVLLGSADFGIVPGASGAQNFGADVLAACPTSPRRACPPAWLFDAPRLAEATYALAAWCSVLLVIATVAIALTWWVRRARAGRASAVRS